MLLFDAGTRKDMTPASYSEGQFAFLNRVAGPFWDEVRSLLESWFSNYPSEAHASLRSRFRSSESGFWGAYWELLLHEVLLRIGANVQVDPVVPGGRRPDFVAEFDGEHIMVEATVLLDPESERRSEARRAPVLDALQQLETSSYWINVEVVAEGPDQASGRRLRSQVQEWIDGLDPSTVEQAPKVRGKDGVVRSFEDRGWRIEVTAIRRGEGHFYPTTGFHLGPVRGRWVDDHAAIRNDLRNKARKYRDAQMPLVLAVLNTRWTASEEELALALYGPAWEHPGMMKARRINPSWRSVPEGLWITRSGPRYKDVVAVLASSHVAPPAVARASLTLWHNPDASTLAGLPFDHVIVDQASGSLERQPSSVRLHELFGLSPDWPPGEPFPGRSRRRTSG